MPDRELTIGQVAERSGLAHSALRFYEERGLISSTRTSGNQRRYPRDVLRRLAVIRIAQRVGLTLEDIAEALDSLPAHHAPDGDDWQRLSQRWRTDLEERIELLTSLRDELSSCIGCGCLSLERCQLYNPDDAAARLGAGPRYLLGDSAADVAPPHTR